MAMKTKCFLICFVSALLIAQNASAQTVSVGGDSLPRFKGGDEALVHFLRKNTHYPNRPKKEGVRGTVIVKFNVDYLGKMCNIGLIQGVNPFLDAEALRVVSLLGGRWEPSERDSGPATSTRVINFKFGIP
jgi:TonB family protein